MPRPLGRRTAAARQSLLVVRELLCAVLNRRRLRFVATFVPALFKLQRYEQPIRRTVAGNGEERDAQIELVQERLNRVHPAPETEGDDHDVRPSHAEPLPPLGNPDPDVHVLEIRLPLRLVSPILTRT
jgi:hypothetical protein